VWCAVVRVVINFQLPKRVGVCRVGDVLLVSRILLLDVLLANIDCFAYFRPAPPIKNVRGQTRKNEVTKPGVRPQRTANVGKKPDPKTIKKDEKPKPVKKEEKKEDNKVRFCHLPCAVAHLKSKIKDVVVPVLICLVPKSSPWHNLQKILDLSDHPLLCKFVAVSLVTVQFSVCHASCCL